MPRWLRTLLGRHGQHHLSEIDRFLQDFEAQRTVEPASRVATRLKHAEIARKRDTP